LWGRGLRAPALTSYKKSPTPPPPTPYIKCRVRSVHQNDFMNLSQLVKQKRRQVLEIAQRHGAREVRIFGSVARGEAAAGSDLDLLVEMEPGRSLLDLVAVKQDLEELLGCKVDVVTEASVSPYLRDRVLSEAIRL
jgi:predicted nucleotidyltransferase